jgi:uncharacterized protein YdeI (YjbR/CyaY-like superfamily)
VTVLDPRVDAYIAKAAPFARPLLATLRERMHAASPELHEDIKWGMPFFVYAGRPLAHMAGFKQHCALGFWRGREVVADDSHEGEAMGQFGRITQAAELPGARELKALVKTAVARIEAEAAAPPAPAAKRAPKPLPEMPADLAAALGADAAARRAFDALPHSHRREYLEWILQAKREATRAQRLAQTVERLRQGLKFGQPAPG